jgi:hypothetical protein
MNVFDIDSGNSPRALHAIGAAAVLLGQPDRRQDATSAHPA